MAKGSLKHFMPHTGAYVYVRTLGEDRVIVIMNGRDTDLSLDMRRYDEIMNIGDVMHELLTDSDFTVTTKLILKPRQTIVLTLPEVLHNPTPRYALRGLSIVCALRGVWSDGRVSESP